uniref:Cytochrome b n=1 Tax=Phatnoma laciniatum TaxID=1964415 RepID=A0A343BTA2_9HEMI|nr:cytochrome b [Phatnoma laciniatum]ARB50167.1 cytochrome b [Phatnoma laciniatum]
MNKPLYKKNPMLKLVSDSLINLPTPSNINLWWNFGSMMGIYLMIQIITGVFLAMHFTANSMISFDSIIHINRNVNFGWLIQYLHMNGASLFFFMMYMHIGRGLYYGSYKLKKVWMVGIMIYILTMATAFLGYVLPWGQMSLWGATVITNLTSAIPYLGDNIVKWLWGGFSVNNATLTRFFTLHFILPFILAAMILIHLMFLHTTGSNNPLGMNSNYDMMQFHSKFTTKDFMSMTMILILFMWLNLTFPLMLNDPENFTQANPMVTPTHIQPEWYFLFAYAILRSIPNKLGGVITMLMSILILVLPMISMNSKFQSTSLYPMNKIMFWMFMCTMILLTWIGMCPVEYPFISTGQILTIIYFNYFLMNPIITMIWDNY